MRTSIFYTLAFLFSLLSLLLFSVLLLRGFDSIKQYADVAMHRNRILYSLEQLDAYMSRSEASQRGFLLTGDNLFLRDMTVNEDSIHSITQQLNTLTEDEATETTSFALIRNSINIRMKVLRENIQWSRRGIDSAMLRSRLMDGKQWMDVFQQQVKIIANEELRQLNDVYLQQRRHQALMPGYLRVALFFSGSIAVVSFLLLWYEWKQRNTYEAALEKKLDEVNYYNHEMKEVAYVTSHGLQEPLRKLLLFCDMLLQRQGGQLDEEGRTTVNRIRGSAHDMHQMVENLMLFTNMLRGEEKMSAVKLDKVVERVMGNLSSQIEERKAKVTTGSLPEVTGYNSQLLMLFTVLIDNSLNFSRSGVPPVVHISAQYIRAGSMHPVHKKVSNENFYCITVEDNGMGFDNQFAEKIFSLFQRLHSQSKGRGIGLAVGKRIMANHDGFITAEGVVDGGARFYLYFPA